MAALFHYQIGATKSTPSFCAIDSVVPECVDQLIAIRLAVAVEPHVANEVEHLVVKTIDCDTEIRNEKKTKFNFT